MSDYLTDEEQLARLKSWWDDNGTSTIVGLVLVIVAVVGWRWYDGYRADAIARASDLYEDFLASEGVARDTIVTTLASEAPDTAYYALALMHLARDAVADGDYEAAERHLQLAITEAPEPELADLARLRLARVQQQGDRSEAALQTLGAIRSAGFRSHVAELQGDIELARGERRLAYESYSAALADGVDEDRRPLLELKVADTADVSTQPLAAPESAPENAAAPAEASVPEPVAQSLEETTEAVVAPAAEPDQSTEVKAPDA